MYHAVSGNGRVSKIHGVDAGGSSHLRPTDHRCWHTATSHSTWQFSTIPYPFISTRKWMACTAEICHRKTWVFQLGRWDKMRCEKSLDVWWKWPSLTWSPEGFHTHIFIYSCWSAAFSSVTSRWMIVGCYHIFAPQIPMFLGKIHISCWLNSHKFTAHFFLIVAGRSNPDLLKRKNPESLLVALSMQCHAINMFLNPSTCGFIHEINPSFLQS